jgi:hypothetical protein
MAVRAQCSKIGIKRGARRLGGSSADTPAAFAARWAALPPPLNGWTARHLPADLIQRPTPRIVEGARRLCAHLDAVRGVRR